MKNELHPDKALQFASEIEQVDDYSNGRFYGRIEGYKASNELHPVQIALLEKFGFEEQLEKLSEELIELDDEILRINYFINPIGESFYREFIDVRNLMQQIESKLDPKLLEKYEAEMFKKIKNKYLNT